MFHRSLWEFLEDPKKHFTARRPKDGSRIRPARLGLETLEDRWVLSGVSAASHLAASLAANVQQSTTTVLTAPTNPTVYGQEIDFTAAVSPSTLGSGSVTGKVSFTVNGKPLATRTLVDGQALFSTSSLGVGSHSVMATYAGSSKFSSSNDTISDQIVDQASTVTFLAGPAGGATGQAMTFTAEVDSQSPGQGKPVGSVTLKDWNTVIATANLKASASAGDNGAVATFHLSKGLSAGPHSLVAVYGGNTSYSGGSSNTLVNRIEAVATTTLLASSANPAATGEQVTYTARVTPAAGETVSTSKPEGYVDFYDDGVKVAVVALDSSAIAQWSTTYAVAASHSIRTVYEGDSNFSSNASDVMTEVCVDARTQVALSALVKPELPQVIGQPITFSAAVTAAAATKPTGIVTFYDGTAPLGTGTLNAQGVATFTASALSEGSHSITATYNGDAIFSGSTSAVLTQNITLPEPGYILGNGAIQNGQNTFSVGVQASVSQGVPTYSVYPSGSTLPPLSFTDTNAGFTLTATTITSVSMSPASVNIGSVATITGTGTLTIQGGDAGTSYNFVAYVLNWNAGTSTSSSGVTGNGFWISVAGPNHFQYSSGGLLTSGSVTIAPETSSSSLTASPRAESAAVTPTTVADGSARTRQELFAAWAEDDFGIANSPMHHDLL